MKIFMDYTSITNKQEKLIAGQTYHIYNKAIGYERLFVTDTDYFYFLKKMSRYLLPIAHVIAYCLIPNHFHLLVNLKDKDEVLPDLTDKIELNNYISRTFSNFFNSYTKSFNLIKHITGLAGCFFIRLSEYWLIMKTILFV